eukprot:3949565-Prymnesium_polylepis.1
MLEGAHAAEVHGVIGVRGGSLGQEYAWQHAPLSPLASYSRLLRTGARDAESLTQPGWRGSSRAAMWVIASDAAFGSGGSLDLKSK